jgi:hypothetical protein
LKEEYELIFEFEIEDVLKKKQKKKFIHSLEKEFLANGVSESSLKESYYLLFKDVNKARVFVIIIKVVGSIKNIIKTCNKIVKEIYGNQLIRVEIFIKKGANYFARYVKIPNETGYFQIVKNENLLPYPVGKIVLSEISEV